MVMSIYYDAHYNWHKDIQDCPFQALNPDFLLEIEFFV